MSLSNIVWILWYFAHHCSALRLQEISFLEEIELGTQQINLEDYLSSNDDIDEDHDANSTQYQRFSHGRVKRSVEQEYGSHNPIKGKFSRRTITYISSTSTTIGVDLSNDPIISDMVQYNEASLVASAKYLYHLKISNQNSVGALAWDTSSQGSDFVPTLRGSATFLFYTSPTNQFYVVQILKGEGGLMQLRLNDVQTLNHVKSIYFTDGAAVDDDSGTISISSFSVGQELGWYLALTYPMADGSQRLRVYFTTGTDFEPVVSSSRIEDFSGTDNLKDIEMFTTGDTGYLAIARDTKSLLFKFSGENSDAKLKLDSTFPAALKVEALHDDYNTHLIWVKDGGKSDEWIYSSGFFAQVKKDAAGSVEDQYHEAYWADTDHNNLFKSKRMFSMLVSGNMLEFYSSRSFELPAEASVSGAKVLGLGWLSLKLYVYVRFADGTVNAYELTYDAEDTDVSYINHLHQVVTEFFDKTDRLNYQLNAMATDLVDSNNGLISLSEGKTPISTLRAKETTFNEFKDNPSKPLRVNLHLIHDPDVHDVTFDDWKQVTYSDLNYKDENSKLSVLSKETTLTTEDSSYLLKNVILKNGGAPITIQNGKTLTADKVTIKNAKINEINVKTVSGPGGSDSTNVNEFLTQSLLIGDSQTVQNIEGPVTFKTVSATNVKFKDSASASAGTNKVEPSKMLSLDDANTVTTPMKFKNMHIGVTSAFTGKINDIRIENIVPKTSGTPITVSGKKTFSQGLKASGTNVAVTMINNKPQKDVFLPNFFLSDPGKDSDDNYNKQTIQTEVFKFSNLIVKENLIIEEMGTDDNKIKLGQDVLSNIVRVDRPSKVMGKTTFSGAVNINNLVSKDVNEIDPEHMLINGVDQTIPFPLKFDELIVTNNFQSTYLNSMKLDSDVARTDQNNDFTAAITFGDLAVKTKVDADELVTIDTVDVSELTDPIQQYDGVVTITENLFIDQEDVSVTKMDFGALTDEPMDKNHLEKLFLYKDSNQVLPNLVTIGSSTTGTIDDLYVKTLDGLDLKDEVMHNAAGSETTNANVEFVGETIEDGKKITNKVYKKMTIKDGNGQVSNVVGGHDIADLYSHIYCPDSGTTTYNGKKTVAANSEVVSLFDVESDTKASFNSREFVSAGTNHFINKDNANIFTKKMTFSDKLEVSGDLKPSSHVVSPNDAAVLLNGKNVKGFESSIVKKTETYTGTINTVVTMGARMATDKKMIITKDTGIVDDKNIFTYLDDRVLLDEVHDINVKLTAPNIHFKKGITIVPEANDKAYFCGKDLLSYYKSLFTSTSTSLSGEKTVKGDITVKGNLVFPENVHPFGVDLGDLKSNALSRTKDQTISVPYIIDSVGSVDKMTVKKVDGVDLDDLCLINSNCDIVCEDNVSPCVRFKSDLTATGGISFDKLEGITMANASSKLDENDNNYNLDLLTVSASTGDFDWTNDKPDDSVSNLYDKLVVKSDDDWTSRTPGTTREQDITGDVTINGETTFTTISLTSNIVNEGLNADGFSEFKFNEIIADAARKASQNTFTTNAVKTFSKKVEAKEADVKKLEGVKHYDDIVLNDYRNNMLALEDEKNPGNTDFTQTISEPWTLSNGINVNNLLNVKEAIDGVDVEDFVLKNKFSTREIPKVTFNEDIVVKGDVITQGTGFSTKLNSFMDNRIKLDSVDTISNNLKFTGTVSLESGVDATIMKLNGIPSSTWVKTGVDVDTKQEITGKKVISSQLTTIYGNLNTDNIDTTRHRNVNFNVKYDDALKLDEDATIAGPNLVFKEETTLLGENISGDMSAFDALPNLISDIGKFVRSLYNFYNDNIVKVIPRLDKEITIANKLDLGKLGYLEETQVPAYLDFSSISKKIVLTSALELEDNVFSVNAKTISQCGWSQSISCNCESTIIASPLDSPKSPSVDVDHRVFTFTLEAAGTFTVTTTLQSYKGCENPDENQPGKLIVSGFMPEDDVMKLRLNQLSPVDIGTAFPFQDLAKLEAIGHVMDVTMWELNNFVYLAAASDYPVPKVAVFSLDPASMVWSLKGSLNAPPESNDPGFESVERLKAFKFVDSQVEIVHLYVARFSSNNAWSISPNSDVLVYKQTASSTEPEYESKIPAPGFVDFDVFKFYPSTPSEYNAQGWKVSVDEQPQIMMTIACSKNLDFMTNYASFSAWTYEPSSSKFKPAMVPNSYHDIKSELVGIEVDKISDKTVFVIAERSSLHVYRFVPFQGLFLINQIPGNNIVDFAVFKKDHIRDSLNIFVVEENNRSKMYRLVTKDYIPKVATSYGRLKY